jgi:exosome complex component RRP4
MTREIVIPGEVIGTVSQKQGPHTFSLEENVYADVLGIKNEREQSVSVVPLKGKYIPREGDMIIGVVKAERFAGYEININSLYSTFVLKKDLRDPLSLGGVVTGRIMKVNELNEADIGMVHALQGGEVLSVTPARVPRIIGKNSSMLNVVKNGTGSAVLVGKNGLVWLNEGDVELAKESIKMIEDFAFIENLTQYMQQFLANKTGHLPDTQSSNQSRLESQFYRGGERSYSDRGGFHSRSRPGYSRRPGSFSPGGGRGFGNRNRGNYSSSRGNYSSNRGGYGTRGGFSSNRGNYHSNRRSYHSNRNGDYSSERINRSFSDNSRRPFNRNKRIRGDEDPIFE